MKNNAVVAIVGATGVVGREAIYYLNQKNWPLKEVRLFASSRSAGKEVEVLGNKVTVQDIAASPEALKGCDVAVFSAGGQTSRELAPKAVEQGCWVVDNSSAFRMDADKELVTVPVNGNRVDTLKAKGGAHLIANPNCSTIQLVWPLKALHDQFGISDVVVSSYQAVSGAGLEALSCLMNETKKALAAWENDQSHHQDCSGGASAKFPTRIGMNVIPQIGNFDEDGFCEEERKIMRETRKILGHDSLRIVATTVRVPVLNSHAESVMVELQKDATVADVHACLDAFEGIRFYDTLKTQEYPTPRETSRKDTVAVGRLRQDPEQARRFHFWVVADNLRVGAATNAMEIVQRILS